MLLGTANAVFIVEFSSSTLGIAPKGAPRAVFARAVRTGAVHFFFGKFSGKSMAQQTIRLGPIEQRITELLLQGCDNAEIAKQLNMARRTVKAHFNRLFSRFGIDSGIKRVKLATLLYRRQLCLEGNSTDRVCQTNENDKSLSSSHKDSRTARSQPSSGLRNTSSKTIFEPSTTNSDSGIASS
jgi:hypothetical protein